MATPQRKKIATRYSDFKVNFDNHPVKKDLTLNTNEDAVKRSIKNLLFTDQYERFHDPRKGAGLKAFLFENIEQTTADNIKDRIEDVINTYEPRAELIEVEVIAEPDYNRYSAKIVFSIINNPTPVILETILNRIR